MGTEEDKEKTRVHNAEFKDKARNTKILNANVAEWLLGTVTIPDDDEHTRRPDTFSVYARYLRCLLAPNYTVFSNTTSQGRWIKDHGQEPESHYVVSLESPHNAIHLAVGGVYLKGEYNAAPIRGANGDMGDNETAGFDPIFFFHHCFIDYTFAIWQRLHKLTKRGDLTIIPDYPGTILMEGQPPSFPKGTHIDMNTPLIPFINPRTGREYTSNDATDLSELGIAYGPGSFNPLVPPEDEIERLGKTPYEIILPKISDPMTLAGSDPNSDNPFVGTKWVHNISRTDYEGSFIVHLYAQGHDGQELEVGREPILSRYNLTACRNCQNHLDVDMYVPLDPATLKHLEGPEKKEIKWLVKVQAHDGLYEFPGDSRGGESPKIDDLWLRVDVKEL